MRTRWFFGWLVFLLAGCGGGGAGAAGGAAAPTTGSVALLIADGPADEYDAIFVRVFEISLLAGDDAAPVVLFESVAGEEIDLLDLRDEDYLLAVKDDVPAGTYAKIRLRVGEVRAEGGPCENVDTKIPSGKIDLNPRGPIEVRPGGNLAVRLDIDANKSLQLHPAGNSGKCIFRPVVFVEIEAQRAPDRCPRSVVGDITVIRVDDEDEATGFVLDLGGDRGELDVVLGEDTGFFDSDGVAADASIFEVFDTVTVKGRLDADGALEALAVVAGTALSVDGAIDGDFAEGMFVLAPDAGEPVVGDTDVVVADGTAILFGCDDADTDVLVDGAVVTVMGKLSLADDVFRAVSVAVRPVAVEGALVAVTQRPADLEIEVRPEGSETTVFYALPANPGVLLEGDGAVGLDLLLELLDCGELGVTVALDPDDATAALSATVDHVEFEGDVGAVNATARTITLGDETLLVKAGATILDLRDGQATAALGDLAVDDRIRVFGIDACDGDAVDGHAFVVLILPADDEDDDEDE